MRLDDADLFNAEHELTRALRRSRFGPPAVARLPHLRIEWVTNIKPLPTAGGAALAADRHNG